MKKIVIGILAHVDAGKTTLSEAMLYQSGKIKKLGRVDHRDSYLDTHALERSRGITIFSKQAEFSVGNTEFTLLDTPGHVDFSAETERTLSVLDYAVLVISGTDGVQAHTETLWRLLRRYHVPTFLFVTKTDLMIVGREKRMEEIKARLSACCTDFSEGINEEEVALCDEELLSEYLQTDTVKAESVRALIAEEKLFPCYFGSGLKLDGVNSFLEGLDLYTDMPPYGDAFAASVFKIGRDEKGNRLTYMKVTGGRLKVRMPLNYPGGNGEERAEKVSQIRVYSGEEFRTVEEAVPGMACAVLGLTETRPGLGLGGAAGSCAPMLEPVLNYRIVLPEDCDAMSFLPKMRLLEEEDPALHILWNEVLREIHVRLMGDVQIEILKSLVEDRFGVEIDIVDGRILYKETIGAPVVGIGHFEPLRHYAEVHLLMEPLEEVSGLVFTSQCGEEILSRGDQRLILSELENHALVGVLTGSPLTDVKITLAAGRAHLKHTEGGDFRQAAIRAYRQGLMQAENILLEPYYRFELAVPSDCLGRAIHDVQSMNGSFDAPAEEDERMILRGTAPVSAMSNYFAEVVSYTHGKGRLRCEVGGYTPCVRPEEAAASFDYDPLRDTENPSDSVFCAHGGGFSVPWNEVAEYAHVDSGVRIGEEEIPSLPDPKVFVRNLDIDEKELESIMEREFGPIKRRQYGKPAADDRQRNLKAMVPKKNYLIVDGYNMIFAWEGLKELADDDLDLARHKLTELLCNYRGFVRCELILVFDGYKIKGNTGNRFDVDGVHVVYTAEGETGDMYIEKLIHEIGRNDNVRVATSDALIQISALGSGVLRMSARELKEEIDSVQKKLDELIREVNRKNRKLSNRAADAAKTRKV